MKNRIQVALPVYLDGLFDYLVEGKKPAVGTRVKVPFQSREIIGIVWSHDGNKDLLISKLKTIIKVIDEMPIFQKSERIFYEKISNYYQHSLGEVINIAMPVKLRKDSPAEIEREDVFFINKSASFEKIKPTATQQIKALKYFQNQETINRKYIFKSELRNENISLNVMQTLVKKNLFETKKTVKIPGLLQGVKIQKAKKLNTLQQEAVDKILQKREGYICWLLHGITGSGKTEVYLHLISTILATGKQILMLVPEIGLAPQTIRRLQQRLSAKMVVLHSGMTDRERSQAWLAAKEGLVDVVIGTRSAIFTPFAKLGLIVVDEEHDLSFKQQDKLRYHARDIAVLKAQQQEIPIVLGSATPSLESLFNVQQNRYQLLKLISRAGKAKPPNWELLDLRRLPVTQGLSQPLIERIGEHLQQKQQVMIFLNRRGFSPALMCYDCGWLADCRRCDARFTLHQKAEKLICHHCDSQQSLPQKCPHCQSHSLRPLGIGTERLEQHLQVLFPQTAVIRIDRDSTRKKGAMEEKLAIIHQGGAAILIGTQMLAKGHHFPNVTLVAVVDADGMLFSSDFRAMEKGAQLLIQVGGRAGRGTQPGTVLLQTCHPQHALLQLLLREGYAGFSQQELQTRSQAALPPYNYLALLRAEAVNSQQVKQLMESISQQFKNTQQNVVVSAPIPAVMFKRQGRYRYQILIQSKQRSARHQLLMRLRSYLNSKNGRKLARNVRWSLDVDPQEMV